MRLEQVSYVSSFWACLGIGTTPSGEATWNALLLLLLLPQSGSHVRPRCLSGMKGFEHGSLNVPIEHHPTIRYMVYNGYYKVMSNIPKMGHLPTPVETGKSFPPAALLLTFDFACFAGSVNDIKSVCKIRLPWSLESRGPWVLEALGALMFVLDVCARRWNAQQICSL